MCANSYLKKKTKKKKQDDPPQWVAELGRKSKDRPTRAPNVVFVVASHYQSLQIIVLLLQACLLEIYLFCRI